MNSIVTVTTAASTQNLTDLPSVKLELGITGTSEDAKLTAWISQASQMIASHCKRVFGAETVSEAFRLEKTTGKLILSRFPVVSVVSITEDDVVLTAADYERDDSTGLLNRLSDDFLSNWPSAKITVAYHGGYELLDGLPTDIQRACNSLVGQMRFQSMRDPMAKRIEIPDVRTVDYWVGQVGESGSMPPDVLDLLTPYVNMRF